jgi:choline-sulfatase
VLRGVRLVPALALARTSRAWLLWFLLLGSAPALALGLGEAGTARQIAFRGTRFARLVLDALRWSTDIDGDGFSSLLGGGDCRPFDADVFPGAREIPGNGMDDDCWGGDAPVATRAQAREPRHPQLPPGVRPAANLLLLSIDALRADHVGAYGYTRPITPQLDRFASGAVLFERAYSPSPATRWALPVLQVGRWPSEIRWDQRPWPHEVANGEQPLAELLRRQRFVTGAVWLFRSTMGLSQGFVHWERTARLEGAVRATEVSDEALELLEKVAGQRFYVWVHYFDPHGPYLPHEQPDLPRFGHEPIDRYDEEIALVDREVGRLLAKVDALGLRQDTVVVITADHGEEFGDHGGLTHSGHLYDELVHVPLLLRGPGLEARRIPAAISLVDLVPTALDLLGIPNVPLPRLSGESLVPLLLPGSSELAATRTAFSSLAFSDRDPYRSRAVMMGAEKLIYDPPSGLVELYDLKEDPWEKRNLAESYPEPVHRLMGVLLPWMASTSPEGHARP